MIPAFGRRRRWRAWAIAGACVAALAGPARAQEAPKQERAEANPAERGARRTGPAAEVVQALRELSDAVRREAKQAAQQDDSVRSDIPPKQAAPPALTPKAIDDMIARHLEEAGVAPARRTTDEVYVRRIYLDLLGRLPTPEETRAFVQDRARNKRAKLVDKLLERPEFARNWARYWRDVIRYRATVDQPRLVDYPALEAWLAEKFAANTPWDEVARGMITATGTSEENGATVFLAAHQARPVEVAGEVSRIFMGVQIQCAQCHDHKTDPWKREQFHGFAAFFAGVQSRRQQQQPIQIQNRRGAPRYTMPDLADPQKSIPVEPSFFLASSSEPLPKGLTVPRRRELAAEFVTDQSNPWFARAYVNRVWYVLMGDAFVLPVDDLGPDRDVTYPDVFEALSEAFARSGYDTKWLFRTILNTRTYQREVRSTHSPAGQVSFAANCASRLRADQIYDSLAAVGVDLDAIAQARRARAAGQAQGKAAAAANPRRPGPRGLFDTAFGVDPSLPNDDVMDTIPQALFLMNSPAINTAVRADPNKVLGKILAANPDNRAALDALYLRVLARRPSPQEVQVCGRYITRVGDRREAFEDIFWSLINSTEFISRR